MKKEEFKAFCKGRHLTLKHLRFYFGIEEEEIMNDYASGALPIPNFISEKIEEIIFSDITALPASSQEEKLDQLLSSMNQLPHQGAVVNKKVAQAVDAAQHSKIDKGYLGYDATFWQAFQQLYEMKCRTEKVYVQGALFTTTNYYHQVG